jgi:hypothetical protein
LFETCGAFETGAVLVVVAVIRSSIEAAKLLLLIPLNELIGFIMAGDKMEDLLLGGDDSSSGESDTEPTRGPPVPNAPAAVPPVVTAPSSAMSQSEMAQRLKSLYSPASKAGAAASPMAAPAVPPAQKPPQPLPTQQQHLMNNTSRPPSSSSSSVAQQQQMRGMMHPQQMAQQQRNSSGLSHPQQQLQQRTGSGGMSLQQQSVPNMATHPSSEQQRSSSHSMQSSSVSSIPQQQHRPTSRLPHQQRPPQHSMPQAANNNAIPPQSRPQPTGPTQQMTAPQRSSNLYGSTTSGGSSAKQPMPLQQQIPTSAMDRAVLEKKQKERFLVFTRVLMVCFIWMLFLLCFNGFLIFFFS